MRGETAGIAREASPNRPGAEDPAADFAVRKRRRVQVDVQAPAQETGRHRIDQGRRSDHGAEGDGHRQGDAGIKAGRRRFVETSRLDRAAETAIGDRPVRLHHPRLLRSHPGAGDDGCRKRDDEQDTELRHGDA